MDKSYLYIIISILLVSSCQASCQRTSFNNKRTLLTKKKKKWKKSEVLNWKIDGLASVAIHKTGIADDIVWHKQIVNSLWQLKDLSDWIVREKNIKLTDSHFFFFFICSIPEDGMTFFS